MKHGHIFYFYPFFSNFTLILVSKFYSNSIKKQKAPKRFKF